MFSGFVHMYTLRFTVSHLLEGAQLVSLGTSHFVGAQKNSFCGWHKHLFRLTDFLSGGSLVIDASTRWILCVFLSVAKEKRRDVTFPFLLFIRVFILFICIFILEYICQNLSDVLNIQRKWQFLDFVICTSNAQDFHTYTENRSSCFAVFISSCNSITHNLRNIFLFPVILSILPFVLFCFLFKRAAHFLLTIPLVVSSHVFMCPIASVRHKSLIVTLPWPALVLQVISSRFSPILKLVLKQQKTVKPVEQKGRYFVLYRGFTTTNSPPQSLARTQSSTGKYEADTLWQLSVCKTGEVITHIAERHNENRKPRVIAYQ